MRRGKQRQFSAKAADGLPLGDYIAAAALGHICATAGARIIDRALGPIDGSHLLIRSSIGSDAWGQPLLAAVEGLDGRTIHECADALDARRAFRDEGPAAPYDYWAAVFVFLCGNSEWRAWDSARVAVTFRSPTLLGAWQREPFTPAATQIHAFLCEILPCAPDERTAQRIAKRLNIAARAGRPKKPTQKAGFVSGSSAYRSDRVAA